MLILNGGGLPTLLRWREGYPGAAAHLGRLARPRHIGRLPETLRAGIKVGVDNDAFASWDLVRFTRQIGHIERALYGRILTHGERIAALATLGMDGTEIGLPPHPPLPPWDENLLFVTVPDVPYDAKATAGRFADWAPLLSHLPLALCIQDGAGDVGIPWGWPNLRALFLAGSTDYKLSTEMAEICWEGKVRGLHLHGGRINSRERIRRMLEMGVDSIDGTGFDRYRDKNLAWGLDEVSAASSVTPSPTCYLP